jgi:hypothetical protein
MLDKQNELDLLLVTMIQKALLNAELPCDHISNRSNHNDVHDNYPWADIVVIVIVYLMQKKAIACACASMLR